MQFLGITPNTLNIWILEKKGGDFAFKTQYFGHKEQFHFVRLQNVTVEKIHLKYI
jgi:hypothetical protein